MTNYQHDTFLAYQSNLRARSYKEHYTSGFTWMRVTTNVERMVVRSWLEKREYPAQAVILDAPCGTGLMGSALSSVQSRVVASDIAREMMELARPDYSFKHFAGFSRADIMGTPFADATFECVLTIGLLHRLPDALRRKTVAELCRISKRDVIVSMSLDTPFHRAKRKLLGTLPVTYGAAPAPAPRADLLRAFEECGFHLLWSRATIPLLSSDVLFLFTRGNL